MGFRFSSVLVKNRGSGSKNRANPSIDQLSNRSDLVGVSEPEFGHLVDTVLSQQKFLEMLDAKNRANNVVITGASEIATVFGAVTDKDKITAILAAVGCNAVAFEHRRLGKAHVDHSPRPLLISLPTVEVARKVVASTKPIDGDFTDIHIKRDIHPAFRKEWGRLYRVENAEKQKAENGGRLVTFDKKKRQILVDNVIVDYWKLDF